MGQGPNRLLLDTGEGKPSWSHRLSSILRSECTTISQALITHWHPDHVGGVTSLLSLCPKAAIYKYDPGSGQNPIHDGQIFEAEGAKLRAFHCPGHTTDHTAFILEEEDAMFTGDNILGHGTAVFEDLTVYLNSLSRMRGQFHGRAYPGHVGGPFSSLQFLFGFAHRVIEEVWGGESALESPGGLLSRASNMLTCAQGTVIEDGPAKIDEYITHRKQREEEILQALREIGKATSMDLVKVVYKDVPENLHKPAATGVVQVLRKLEGEGNVIQRQHERWQIADKATL